MTVKKYEETKTLLVFETPSHRFKIPEGKLDKLKDSKKYPENVKKYIQKSMKQIVDNSNGEFWQESFDEIFTEVTKGTLRGE